MSLENVQGIAGDLSVDAIFLVLVPIPVRFSPDSHGHAGDVDFTYHGIASCVDIVSIHQKILPEKGRETDSR